MQVEKESLADKAGIEVNDTITELAGRNVSSMSLQEARNIIERPSDEIYMLLQRYCLTIIYYRVLISLLQSRVHSNFFWTNERINQRNWHDICFYDSAHWNNKYHGITTHFCLSDRWRMKALTDYKIYANFKHFTINNLFTLQSWSITMNYEVTLEYLFHQWICSALLLQIAELKLSSW